MVINLDFWGMGQILRYGIGIATSISQTEPKFFAESPSKRGETV